MDLKWNVAHLVGKQKFVIDVVVIGVAVAVVAEDSMVIVDGLAEELVVALAEEVDEKIALDELVAVDNIAVVAMSLSGKVVAVVGSLVLADNLLDILYL